MRYIFREELYIQSCTIDGRLSSASKHSLITWVMDIDGAEATFLDNSNVGNCYGYMVCKDWCEVVE